MRRWMAATGMAVAVAAATPGPVAAQTPYEGELLTVVNALRADPQGFAAQLRTFRAWFRGNAYVVPGEAVRNVTDEGVAAVDEAIAFLVRQRPLPPIRPAALLAAAAVDHVTEQGATGAVGHGGEDGSSPGDRVRRHGGGDQVAEVIEYGATGALDAIRQLVVDDGVADRGHRAILFDPALRYAGVSCGAHQAYRSMCVIDLGVARDGRDGPAVELASGE